MNINEDYDYVEGRNAVLELLNSNKPVDKILIAPDLFTKLKDITKKARENNVIIVECDRRKLDTLSLTKSHQGVIAKIAFREYCTPKDILDLAHSRNEKPFIIILDGIKDPHNLGAIIRSAESFGAHGIIIPKRRAVGLTSVVSKTSAGALEHMLISKVSNITQTIEFLKENGVWIFGAEASFDTKIEHADFKGSTALVIGSEGEGISNLVRKNCDFLISIPMIGNVNSLNASVACGILMYEVSKKRTYKE